MLRNTKIKYFFFSPLFSYQWNSQELKQQHFQEQLTSHRQTNDLISQTPLWNKEKCNFKSDILLNTFSLFYAEYRKKTICLLINRNTVEVLSLNLISWYLPWYKYWIHSYQWIHGHSKFRGKAQMTTECQMLLITCQFDITPYLGTT